VVRVVCIVERLTGARHVDGERAEDEVEAADEKEQQNVEPQRPAVGSPGSAGFEVNLPADCRDGVVAESPAGVEITAEDEWQFVERGDPFTERLRLRDAIAARIEVRDNDAQRRRSP
jgi:hypothetical protein